MVLTYQQRYAIASTLATGSLQSFLVGLAKAAYLTEEVKAEATIFAQAINKHYKKRDGFIPEMVLSLLTLCK